LVLSVPKSENVALIAPRVENSLYYKIAGSDPEIIAGSLSDFHLKLLGLDIIIQSSTIINENKSDFCFLLHGRVVLTFFSASKKAPVKKQANPHNNSYLSITQLSPYHPPHPQKATGGSDGPWHGRSRLPGRVR
jgi:hypothetical protein